MSICQHAVEKRSTAFYPIASSLVRRCLRNGHRLVSILVFSHNFAARDTTNSHVLLVFLPFRYYCRSVNLLPPVMNLFTLKYFSLKIPVRLSSLLLSSYSNACEMSSAKSHRDQWSVYQKMKMEKSSFCTRLHQNNRTLPCREVYKTNRIKPRSC